MDIDHHLVRNIAS